MSRDDGDPAVDLGEFLEAAVQQEVSPGIVALIAEGEEVLYLEAMGSAQAVPSREPLQQDALFDVASLTKPLVTAALVAVLEQDLGLEPDRRAREFLEELRGQDHRDITVGQLLSHRAGLPAWRPFYLQGETPGDYLQALREEPLVGAPGRQVIYSDLGYIAAGEVLRRAAGSGLAALFDEVLARPLGLDARFSPAVDQKSRCAATEQGEEYERTLSGPAAGKHSRWRTEVIRGEVHDHHAWIAGGELGSSGLFATASDVHRMALECLEGGRGLIGSAARRRLWSGEQPLVEGDAWGQGFALNRGRRGSCGPALSEASFGHLGFTGCSLWIDPERRRIYVVLTNRIHPKVREATEIAAFRREFHRLAAEI